MRRGFLATALSLAVGTVLLAPLSAGALTPAPLPENRKPDGLVLGLPWSPGEARTIGWAFDWCDPNGDQKKDDGDHCNSDRYALDFWLQRDEDVLAVAPGTVLYAGQATEGFACYGYIVVVEHLVDVDGSTLPYQSLYSDLRADLDVTGGQAVVRGQKLGEASGTGCSGTVHLHFALYRDAGFCYPLAEGQTTNGCNKNGIGPHDGTPVIPEPFEGQEPYQDLHTEQVLTAADLGPGAPRGDITVEGAHPRWTETGIAVREGDVLRFNATGLIFWDPAVPEPQVGPDGASWNPSGVGAPDQFQLQDAPIASLIGAIDDWVFPIGSEETITSLRSGPLQLGMNERWVDGAWDDNSGAWQAQASVEP